MHTNLVTARGTWVVSVMSFSVRRISALPPPSFRALTLLFPEFDFRVVGDGRSAVARYANNSNYRNDSLIRKESEQWIASPAVARQR